MNRLRIVGTVTALSVMSLALVGCSDDEPPSPTPTRSTSTAPTSSPSPTTSATTGTASPTSSASPTGTASAPAGFSLDAVSSPRYPDLGGDLGAIGVVRVGRHTGYDRVVWQFPGGGRPSFKVQYVDQPIADGSGDVVDVPGDAFLEVLISAVGIPSATAPRPRNASAASLSGTVIEQARPVYGGFEAVGQSFVGVRDRERPFRVAVLTSPTRLVVDIFSG